MRQFWLIRILQTDGSVPGSRFTHSRSPPRFARCETRESRRANFRNWDSRANSRRLYFSVYRFARAPILPFIVASSSASPFILEKIGREKSVSFRASPRAQQPLPTTPLRFIDVVPSRSEKRRLSTSTGFLIYRRRSVSNIDVVDAKANGGTLFPTKLLRSFLYETRRCVSSWKIGGFPF